MPGILERNLESLAHINSPLAQHIQNTPIPEGYARINGADGAETFSRISNTPGAKRIDWLGNTSMPRASAAPIAGALDAFSKGANGLGLTIGTGHEWAAFIQDLPIAQMLYVFEPDLALLRMAFDICDLSQYFASRRLVLLPPQPQAAADWLTNFLAQNIGFEPPTVLHPPPSLAGPKKNELLSRGESIIRHAVRERNNHIATVREKILSLLANRPIAPVHLAFLLTHRYPLERPLASAAADPVYVDRHDSASPLMRMERLADQLASPPSTKKPSPNRIQSDLFREQLATVPPAIPIETWIPPLIGPAFWERVPAAQTFAPVDRIIAHAGHHVHLLKSRGIPAEQIELRPLTPPKNFASVPAPAFALRHRVALLADLPPMDAKSLGIQLPTHQAVFAAARDLIAEAPLAIHPAMVLDLLRRALARAGVDPKTEDPSLGEPMLRILRDVLIPHLPIQTLAETLAAAEIPLLLLGDWTGTASQLKVNGTSIAAAPFATYSVTAWEQVAVFAHVSPTGVVSPFVWEAVAAGVPIAAPQHPSDAQAGSITTLLKSAGDFAHPPATGFMNTLKQLLRDAPRREKLAAAATEAARAHLQHKA